MRITLMLLTRAIALLAPQPAAAHAALTIKKHAGQCLARGNYPTELNQHGELGRNRPVPDPAR